MGAAEHKLSRREALAGACAGAAVPLPRHPELVSGSSSSPAVPDQDWMLKQVQHDGRAECSARASLGDAASGPR